MNNQLRSTEPVITTDHHERVGVGYEYTHLFLVRPRYGVEVSTPKEVHNVAWKAREQDRGRGSLPQQQEALRQ